MGSCECKAHIASIFRKRMLRWFWRGFRLIILVYRNFLAVRDVVIISLVVVIIIFLRKNFVANNKVRT